MGPTTHQRRLHAIMNLLLSSPAMKCSVCQKTWSCEASEPHVPISSITCSHSICSSCSKARTAALSLQKDDSIEHRHGVGMGIGGMNESAALVAASEGKKECTSCPICQSPSAFHDISTQEEEEEDDHIEDDYDEEEDYDEHQPHHHYNTVKKRNKSETTATTISTALSSNASVVSSSTNLNDSSPTTTTTTTTPTGTATAVGTATSTTSSSTRTTHVNQALCDLIAEIRLAANAFEALKKQVEDDDNRSGGDGESSTCVVDGHGKRGVPKRRLSVMSMVSGPSYATGNSYPTQSSSASSSTDHDGGDGAISSTFHPTFPSSGDGGRDEGSVGSVEAVVEKEGGPSDDNIDGTPSSPRNNEDKNKDENRGGESSPSSSSSSSTTRSPPEGSPAAPFDPQLDIAFRLIGCNSSQERTRFRNMYVTTVMDLATLQDSDMDELFPDRKDVLKRDKLEHVKKYVGAGGRLTRTSTITRITIANLTGGAGSNRTFSGSSSSMASTVKDPRGSSSNSLSLSKIRNPSVANPNENSTTSVVPTPENGMSSSSVSGPKRQNPADDPALSSINSLSPTPAPKSTINSPSNISPSNNSPSNNSPSSMDDAASTTSATSASVVSTGTRASSAINIAIEQLHIAASKDDSRKAMTALANLAHGDSSNRFSIVSSNGIQAIVASMTTNLDSIPIQAQGCRALWKSLCVDHPSLSGESISETGAVLSIVRAMQEHRMSESVQRPGCAAIRYLAVNWDAAARAEIDRTGGIGAVVTAMEVHGPTSPDVCVHGCGALQNLAADRAMRASLASVGGVQSVVDAMECHPERVDVQERGCGALRNLILRGRNAESIIVAGGVDAIKRAMDVHPRSVFVTEHGGYVLGLLQRPSKDRSSNGASSNSVLPVNAVPPTSSSGKHRGSSSRSSTGEKKSLIRGVKESFRRGGVSAGSSAAGSTSTNGSSKKSSSRSSRRKEKQSPNRRGSFRSV